MVDVLSISVCWGCPKRANKAVLIVPVVAVLPVNPTHIRTQTQVSESPSCIHGHRGLQTAATSDSSGRFAYPYAGTSVFKPPILNAPAPLHLPVQAHAARPRVLTRMTAQSGDAELDNDNDVDTDTHQTNTNLNRNSQGGGDIMDVDVGGAQDPRVPEKKKRIRTQLKGPGAVVAKTRRTTVATSSSSKVGRRRPQGCGARTCVKGRTDSRAWMRWRYCESVVGRGASRLVAPKPLRVC